MPPSTQEIFVGRTRCDNFLLLGTRDVKTELKIEYQQRSNPDELKIPRYCSFVLDIIAVSKEHGATKDQLRKLCTASQIEQRK